MPIVDQPRVVVTGGASGLGRALAKHLGERGASVLIADLAGDVPERGALETSELVERAGGKAWTTRCDVSKLAEVEAMIETAKDRMGGVDVMINNAGVAVAGLVGEAPIADWEWIMSINLWGVIYGCHVVAPMFRAQRSGHFINIASLAAIAQAPSMAPYNVTKGAVVALSETLAAEMRPCGAGVTVVCPSFFETNLMKTSRSSGIDATGLAEKLMKRSRIQADDVARAAIACARRNELYALPHPEGKVLWALKRLAPSLYHGTIAPRAAKRMQR
jgi:NAD(P)-dependent dehydrogenase (short-subunit alcohol dehydrogenase family)